MMKDRPVVPEKNRDAEEKWHSRIRWIRLALTFLGAALVSLGLAYVIQHFISISSLDLYDLAWLAYLLVFLLSIVANLSIIVPVPFAISIIIAAATKWDPMMVAFVGSLGGAVGELSGYYAGYLGKKMALPESTGVVRRTEHWIHRYGVWAIFFLALQPVIPFDIGGLVAGAARMPLRKFWPALWLGKFPKYVVLTYAGIGLINFLPPWLH